MAILSLAEAREASSKKRKKKVLSIAELEERAAKLEAESEAFGARGIPGSGAFRTVLDVLSRPNYAVAGAAEELMSGRSVGAAAKRVLSEIGSGIGGLQGQKEGFGEVLEQQGYGTKTLADAIPLLEGTWVGNFGSRGALGLGLDIVTDPLTYVTFGSAGASRAILRKGVKQVVNKQGLSEIAKIRNTLREAPEFAEDLKRAASDQFDPTKLNRAELRLEEAAEDEFLKRHSDAGGRLAHRFVDPGGAKLFGSSIVPGQVFDDLGAGLASGIRSVPGGDRVLAKTWEFGQSMRRGINRLFHPLGELGSLPPGEKEMAIRLHRDFVNTKAATHARLTSALDNGLVDDTGRQVVVENLAKRYKALEKANPDIGRKFYELREGTKRHVLNPEEQAVYDSFAWLYDRTGQTLVDVGLLDADKAAEMAAKGIGYFFHGYKNLDDLAQYHPNIAGPRRPGAPTSTFQEERVFDTFADAERISKKTNEVTREAYAAQKGGRIYPVLEPEYDVLANFLKYTDKYSDSIARKGWAEEAGKRLGVPIPDSFNVSGIREVMEELPQSDEGRKLTEKFFGENEQSFAELAKEVAAEVDPDTVQKIGPVRKALIEDAKSVMSRLSEQDRQEFMRRLTASAGSSSQLAEIELGLEAFEKSFPRRIVNAINPGDVEPSLANSFGIDESRYVIKSGKFWGKRPVKVPKIIADDVDRIRRDILKTEDNSTWNSLVDGFDRLNNLFKLGVYTFWPASAVRDAYSNISNSMFDISVGALDPKLHRDSIKIIAAMKSRKVMERMGNDLVQLGDQQFRLRDMVEMAERMRMVVPGATLAEQVGDVGARKLAPAKTALGRKVRGVKAKGKELLLKATDVRGLIENEAKVQLWLNNIRRGLTPRQAADRANQFLFDYGELSTVERSLFRRFIPFYTFTRKNIALQAQTLVRNPGMQINQLKPFRGRQEENEQMVSWEAEGLKMRLDRDGKTVSMVTGIDLPLRNLDTIWRGDMVRTGRGLAGMVTPILRIWPEIALDTDFFIGRDMKRVESGAVGRLVEHLPAPMRNWIGYAKQPDAAGRPRYSFDGRKFTLLFRSWMASRLVSTSDRVFREYTEKGSTDWNRSLLDIGLGLRRKDVDMDVQLRRKLEERIRMLEDSLLRRGRRLTYQQTYKPLAVKESDKAVKAGREPEVQY